MGRCKWFNLLEVYIYSLTKNSHPRIPVDGYPQSQHSYYMQRLIRIRAVVVFWFAIPFCGIDKKKTQKRNTPNPSNRILKRLPIDRICSHVDFRHT